MPEFDYQEGDIIRAGHGYKVLKQLGSGGMSGCYLGEHRKMYRRCAIKVLHSRLWNRPDLIEMFEYEGRTIARLGHPAPHEGIIEILDLGRTSDRGEMPYLVMPYLFGETLDSALKRVGPFSVLSAIGMTTRLLLALQYAHERGVIHRDVKPHNIFLVQPQLRSVLPDASKASEIVVKLLDWGIMKLVSSVDDRGVFIGTPAWASPEQIAGDGVGTSSDLYSAGVVLFETLTGKRPFVSERNDRDSLLRARSGPAPRLGVHGSFPAELEELVARLLAHDPVKRPADARSVVLDLQAIADRIRSSADHVTDHGVFATLPNGDHRPQPITVGSIAAPTIEDAGVSRRILEEVERQAALRRASREEAAGSSHPPNGFDSTVEERAKQRSGVTPEERQRLERTLPVGADPAAMRRVAETNLPAPASSVDGPALSIKYVTAPVLRLGPNAGGARASPQTTLPLPNRPGARPMPAQAGSHGARSGAHAKEWLAHVARKPSRGDAFKLAFAGISAAGLMLVALWVLGLWPTRASVSAAKSDAIPAEAEAAEAPAPVASEAAPPASPAVASEGEAVEAATPLAAGTAVASADTAAAAPSEAAAPDAGAASAALAPSGSAAAPAKRPTAPKVAAPAARAQATRSSSEQSGRSSGPSSPASPASASRSTTRAKDAGAKRPDFIVGFE